MKASSRSGTTNLGRGRSVLGGSVLGCDDLAGGAIDVTNEIGLGFSRFVRVGLWVF